GSKRVYDYVFGEKFAYSPAEDRRSIKIFDLSTENKLSRVVKSSSHNNTITNSTTIKLRNVIKILLLGFLKTI
ncbi:hypothetical protein MHBO_002701, partial [Bonamia ostreae]